jgi:hypothetical protein
MTRSGVLLFVARCAWSCEMGALPLSPPYRRMTPLLGCVVNRLTARWVSELLSYDGSSVSDWKRTFLTSPICVGFQESKRAVRAKLQVFMADQRTNRAIRKR